MPRRVSCRSAKKIQAAIKRKVTGAMSDLKNDRPKAAGIKLHEAAALVAANATGVWDPKNIMTLGNEAFWVGSQLMRPSTMKWPKWKDRVGRLVDNVERIIAKSACK